MRSAAGIPSSGIDLGREQSFATQAQVTDLPSTIDLLPPPDADSLATHASGPSGQLPLSDEILRNWSSGDLFGLTQSAGMGWDPKKLLGDQYLILSTQGGVRAPDGSPIALGYHTGHW